MASGYGNDQTASGSDPGTGVDVAGALAQIFSTGVTAYVDSQAIQRGYQINDPRYFQGGYPAGVTVPYTPTPAGSGVAVTASSSKMLLVVLAVVVVLYALSKK